MQIKPVQINARYQIALPKSVREKLNIKSGDSMLLDVQDGMMILTPQGRKSNYLQGLHSEIWKGVDAKKYIIKERKAWTE